mmetsp:Transcript_78924/g.226165  ORF Transcript_78924/g.226165 Transcript_78924/m.226165 type:complete len:281 (-) Transcript_78924:8-850(-)
MALRCRGPGLGRRWRLTGTVLMRGALRDQHQPGRHRGFCALDLTGFGARFLLLVLLGRLISLLFLGLNWFGARLFLLLLGSLGFFGLGLNLFFAVVVLLFHRSVDECAVLRGNIAVDHLMLDISPRPQLPERAALVRAVRCSRMLLRHLIAALDVVPVWCSILLDESITPRLPIGRISNLWNVLPCVLLDIVAPGIAARRLFRRQHPCLGAMVGCPGRVAGVAGELRVVAGVAAGVAGIRVPADVRRICPRRSGGGPGRGEQQQGGTHLALHSEVCARVV